MPRTPKEYRNMGLTQDEVKDLYDGAASRLCDDLSLMTKYDKFVNRPHTLQEFHDFVLELEQIKTASEANTNQILDRICDLFQKGA